MTPEQFSYWLQGIVDTMETTAPSEAHWGVIKAHLALVFKRKTTIRPETSLGNNYRIKKAK